MTNTQSPNVVAPNANLNVAPVQAGSGVTGTPSAAQPPPPPVSQAAEAFLSTVESAAALLQPSLVALAPKDTSHLAKVGPTERRVIPMVSAMLRANPTLAAAFTADDMDAAEANAAACTSVAGVLKGLLLQVENTGRVWIESAARMSGEVLPVARKRAKRDATLARTVAAINAVTARGPVSDKAEQVALVAQQRAARAEARATKAAAAAKAKAAKAATLQHGKGDATIIQPAPASTPSTPATAPVPTIR